MRRISDILLKNYSQGLWQHTEHYFSVLPIVTCLSKEHPTVTIFIKLTKMNLDRRKKIFLKVHPSLARYLSSFSQMQTYFSLLLFFLSYNFKYFFSQKAI